VTQACANRSSWEAFHPLWPVLRSRRGEWSEYAATARSLPLLYVHQGTGKRSWIQPQSDSCAGTVFILKTSRVGMLEEQGRHLQISARVSGYKFTRTSHPSVSGNGSECEFGDIVPRRRCFG
jgi:hypothetical protein